MHGVATLGAAHVLIGVVDAGATVHRPIHRSIRFHCLIKSHQILSSATGSLVLENSVTIEILVGNHLLLHKLIYVTPHYSPLF